MNEWWTNQQINQYILILVLSSPTLDTVVLHGETVVKSKRTIYKIFKIEQQGYSQIDALMLMLGHF